MADDENTFVEYPKWIDHPTEKDPKGSFPLRVLVKDKKEEEALLGKKPKGGWPTKD